MKRVTAAALLLALTAPLLPVMAFADEATSTPPSPPPTSFTGIGQFGGDGLSTLSDLNAAYQGQVGIRFSAPAVVHYIVVFPDTSKAPFLDCAKSTPIPGQMSVSFGQDIPPWNGDQFLPLQTALRADGGCTYYNPGGVFVYPGASFNFVLHNGLGTSQIVEYKGTAAPVSENRGHAYVASSNSLTWAAPSSLSSFKFLISTTDAPPPDGATSAAEEAYTFPAAPLTPEQLSKYAVIGQELTATSSTTTTLYAYNVGLNSAPFFKAEGMLSYIVAPMSYHDGGAENPVYFYVSRPDRSETSCRTPEKKLFEWGIPNKGAEPRMVVIGPFSGDCFIHAGNESGSDWVHLRISDSDVSRGLGVPGENSRLVMTAYSDQLATTTCVSNCVSSVLFLPGIKGSRLYGDDGKKFWEPGSDDDIYQLFLNSNGSSSRSDIHVKANDVIDEIPGEKIYDSFLKQMNALVSDGVMKAFKAVPYDWRLSLDDLVNKGVERNGNIYYEEASSTPYIEQSLRQLAASSATGKVTIIAHSNGGLVTKALLQKIGDAETAKLVDKIIFVGVPQAGAPQAIGAFLFGLREGIPWQFPTLVHTPIARAFAQSSPMGYHLLPTQPYFDSVQNDPSNPVIQFTSAHLFQKEQAAYGNAIGDLNEFFSYLHADEGGRTQPSFDDVDSADVLSSTLLSYARNIHSRIDAWVPPSTVKLYEIAGWGDDTIAGVTFYEEAQSTAIINGTTRYVPKYRPEFVEDGDGVVPVPSALLVGTSTSNVQRYWVDLQVLKKDHGSFFEAGEVRDFLKSILSSQLLLPSHIYSSQPAITNLDKKLIFFLHSPLTLGISDQSNNYTGSNQDGSVSQNIPGAQYGEFGEVKYLIVPEGQQYTLSLHGLTAGTFSLDIQETQQGTIATTTTISDIPTTASTFASLTIGDGITAITPLSVDGNGDGVVDLYVAFNDAPLSLSQLLSNLTNSIQNLTVKDKLRTQLLNKVITLQAKFEKQKQKQADVLARLKAAVDKKASKGKIDTTSASAITSLIDDLLAEAGVIPVDPATLDQLTLKINALTLTQAQKNTLLVKLTRLSNLSGLNKSLLNFSQAILKKGAKDILTDTEVQSVLSILDQIQIAI